MMNELHTLPLAERQAELKKRMEQEPAPVASLAERQAELRARLEGEPGLPKRRDTWKFWLRRRPHLQPDADARALDIAAAYFADVHKHRSPILERSLKL